MVTVISVGGSLIVPEDVDVDFLKRFRSLIIERVKNGERFAIIAGGGKTCRNYQEAARNVKEMSRDELDWIGIHSTIFNAQFLKYLFGEHAHPELLGDPSSPVRTDRPVLIGAGWKPGHSTDFDTVLLAESLGSKRVINLSNIDFVYDKDPRKHADAEPITNSSWEDFRKLLPEEWSPGLNAPFDPMAAAKAEELGLEVAIMNGKDLENLKYYLDEKDFRGTVIQ